MTGNKNKLKQHAAAAIIKRVNKRVIYQSGEILNENRNNGISTFCSHFLEKNLFELLT